jgi:hypothetical protein
MDMKRVAVLWVGILLLALVPGVVSAQGWLPGLPSFGGVFGNRTGCGEPAGPGFGPLVGYVGWMEGPRGTGFGADTDTLGLGGFHKVVQKYDNRGVWFGLANTITFSDRLAFLASGWYLVPSNTVSEEVFNDGDGTSPLFGRDWNTNSQWWFVDGLFAFGPCCGPASFLVGLRYDYFTTRFQDPPFSQIAPPPAPPTPPPPVPDEADLISQAWIPLIGVQVAYAGANYHLAVRAVGFPTALGTAKYNETILATNRIEASGTYSRGSFLEVFAEYSRQFAGAEIGVFGRWNNLQANSDASVDLLPAGGSQTFRVGVTRISWTFGASFALNFNTPL